MIPALIDAALVVEQLQSTSRDLVLGELLRLAADHGQIAERDLAHLHRTVIERENRGSTGIGYGVAVPHIKGKEVKQLALALGRSAGGIEFHAVDGKPVHTIFLIMAPQHEPEAHLQTLRWVSTLARNADFRRFVSAAPDAARIRELLREMS